MNAPIVRMAAGLFAVWPAVAHAADPAQEVGDAVKRLSEAANYSWEVRQGSFGVSSSLASGNRILPPVLRAPGLRLKPGLWESGRHDRDGSTLIKGHTTERLLGRPQLVASRGARERIAACRQVSRRL